MVPQGGLIQAHAKHLNMVDMFWMVWVISTKQNCLSNFQHLANYTITAFDCANQPAGFTRRLVEVGFCVLFCELKVDDSNLGRGCPDLVGRVTSHVGAMGEYAPTNPGGPRIMIRFLNHLHPVDSVDPTLPSIIGPKICQV